MTGIADAAQAALAPEKKTSGRGGRRPGAGRKKGSGLHLTETLQVCVNKEQKKIFTALGGTRWIRRVIDAELSKLPPGAAKYSRSPMRLRIKLMGNAVQAGFPSPVTDDVEDTIDPAEMLVAHPESTYFVHATGESMIEAGIFPGDLLVVDRALEPRSGDIVIARVNNDYTVKRLYHKDGVLELRPENSSGEFPVFVPHEGDEWYIEGVVVHTVRDLRKSRY